MYRLLNGGNLNKAVYNYYLQHKQQIEQYSSAADYTQRFNNGSEMWDNLLKFTAGDTINYKSIGSKEKEALLQRLKALLARYKWRSSGFTRY